jgi:hypothetical protein
MNLKVIAPVFFTKEQTNMFNIEHWVKKDYGLYKVTDGLGMLHLVNYFKNNDGVVTVFGMPYPIESEEKETEIVSELKTADCSFISGDTLLKALAIAQNPELAVQLLNK